MTWLGWDDETTERARLHYMVEGRSAAATALLIGAPSRNAVIGRIHRTFGPLPPEDARSRMARRGHAKPTRMDAAQRAQLPRCHKPPKKSKAVTPENRPLPSPREALPDSRPTVLVNLRTRQCRWPIGADPAPGCMDQMLFCGARTDECEPYCSQHRRLAVTTPANHADRERAARKYARDNARRYG